MDSKYIKVLMRLANKACRQDEAPIAALIVYRNKIIAKDYNHRNNTNSTVSHAEIEVIMKANQKLDSWRLNNCTMYVTMKPCDMCEKVIKEARLDRVYYLIDRDENKKQYTKTEFIKCSESEHREYIKRYKQKLNTFWQNKRNNHQ